MVSGVRSDYTSQGEEVDPWEGCRGRLWAVPVTWPALALRSMSAQHHQQALGKPLVLPAIPPAWSLLL